MDSKLMPSENVQSKQAPATNTIPAGRGGHLPATVGYNPPPKDEGRGQDCNDEDDRVEAFSLADSPDGDDEMGGALDNACNEEISASFEVPASSETEHYFMDVDPADPAAEDAGGLDQEQHEAQPSITQFLTLPTIVARATSKTRDPIVDFSKLVILTADSYLTTVEHLQEQREGVARDKETKCIQREEI
jgi:hypothetical protein